MLDFKLLLLCAWFLATPIYGQPCSNTNPCIAFRGNESFEEPDVLKSEHGFLSVHLTLDMTELTFDWLRLKRRTFNGKLAAPTWLVRPGDTIYLTVSNLLGPNPVNETGHNTLHKPNTTNIHVHGLHISPEGISDNVFIEIGPGETFDYVFDIHTDHPAGTYWYHPHFHGSSAFQVTSGMSGLIIIEDRPRDLPKSLRKCSCPLNCKNDINMLVQPTLQYSSTTAPIIFGQMQEEIGDDPLFRNDQYITPNGISLSEWLLNSSNAVNYFTVNGQLHPLLNFKAGRMKRMRIANAGGAYTLELEVTASASGATCQWREIAHDGVYLKAPRIPRTGQTLVEAGSRVDWMIKCEHPGLYEIRSVVKASNDQSMGSSDRFNGLIATIHVVIPRRARRNWDFPTRLPALPANMPDLTEVDERYVEKFIYELGSGNTVNRELFPKTGNKIRHKMRLDSVQEWTFVNTQPVLRHPMHIHVNHFQVIRYNKYNGPVAWRDFVGERDIFDRFVDQNGTHCEYQWDGFNPTQPTNNIQLPPFIYSTLGHEMRYNNTVGVLGYVNLGDYRETIPIPPLGNVTIRFIPSLFTGTVVTHCHNTPHSDKGMMMLAEIVEEDESIDGARVDWNGTYPTTCHPGDYHPSMPTPAPFTTTLPPHPDNFFEFFSYMTRKQQSNYPDYFVRP